MPISDKVIELTPVKKSKTILLVIFMSVFLLAAGTFLTLWILKKPATPAAVNSITVSSKNLFAEQDGKLTASANCSYSFSLDVGADTGADKKIEFDIFPLHALQQHEIVGDPEVPGSLTFKFTVNPSIESGATVVINARSVSNEAVYCSVAFTVLHQYADSVNFSALTKTENGKEKVYDIGGGEVVLPLFDDPSRNDYSLTAVQLGPLDSNGSYAKLTQGLGGLDGKRVETLYYETDKPDVLYIDEFTGAVTVLKAGDANVTVWANKFNTAAEKPYKKLKISVKDSSQFDRIYKINFSGEGDSINLFLDENSAQRAYNLREKLSVLPADYKNPFEYIIVYESDKYGNAMTPANSPIRIPSVTSSKEWKILAASNDSAGSTYITVLDSHPDGLNAKLVLAVNVKAPIKKLTAAQTDGTAISEASPINTFRGTKVSAVLSYNLGTATVKEDILKHMLPEMLVTYLAAPQPPDGQPSNIPNYLKQDNNHDYCIVLANSAKQGSDIAVNNLDLSVDGKTVKGKLTFNVGKNVINGEYKIKLKLYPQASSAADFTSPEVSPEIIIRLVVSQEAKNIQFKDGGALESVFAKDALTTLALLPGSADKASLSLNVMNKASAEFSLYDLFFLLDASTGGSVIGGEMTDINKSKFTFIAKSGLLSVDYKILSQSRGFTGDVTVRFKVDNTLTLEKTITVKFTDKVVGLLQDNPNADRNVYYGLNASNAFDTSLDSERNDVIREKLYSGNAGKVLQSTERLVNITVEHSNKQYLLKKYRAGEYNYFFDYTFSLSGTVDTSKALFTEKNGRICVNRDLYELSVSSGKNYGEFEIYFTVEELSSAADGLLSSEMPEAYTSVSYSFIRKASEIRLYTSNDYSRELGRAHFDITDQDYYTVSANKESSVELFPSPVVTLQSGVKAVANKNAKFVLVEGYTLKTVESEYAGVIGSPELIESNNVPDKIKLVTKGASGETKLGLYSFAIASSSSVSQTVLISVEDNALPIASIVVKRDGRALDASSVIALTSFIDGSAASRADFTYEVTYQMYNSKYSMLDSVSVAVGGGNVEVIDLVLPYARISEIPGGIPTSTPYTFTGSFTLVSKNKNTVSDETVCVKSKSKVDNEYISSAVFNVHVTTLIDKVALSDGSIEYVNTEPLVSGGSIKLEIGALDGAPTAAQKTLKIVFKSLNGVTVDRDNIKSVSLKYYENGVEQTGKLSIAYTNDAFVISALNSTLSGYVIFTVVEHAPTLGINDKEYKVRLEITATALTHKVTVTQGGQDRGPTSPISIVTNGDSATTGELEIGCKLNTPTLQPEDSTVGHTFYKKVGGSFLPAADNGIFSIVNQNGSLKLKYKNVVNTAGVEYYFTLSSGGVESEKVPLVLSTSKRELKFVNDSQFSLEGGKLTYNKFTADSFDFRVKVYNVGTGLEASGVAPDDIVYKLTDAEGNPTGIASIAGSVVSINASSGTFKVTAAYTYESVVYTREVTVNLYNRVTSILLAPLPNTYVTKPAGIAAQIWMAKGATLNLNSYVTLKADEGEVYSSAYTLAASSGNVTVSGNVLTAAATHGSGAYTDVTITAPKRDNDSSAPVTAVIRVYVREPRINVTSVPSFELLSAPSATLAFTVTDTLGVAMDYIPDSIVITAGGGLEYSYAAGEHTLTALPSYFLSGLKNADVTISGKMDDGAGGIAFSKTVSCAVTADFKPIVEVEHAESSSIDFNSGLTYTARVTNDLPGFTPTVKYKLTSGSAYAAIDADTGVISYRSGSLGNISVAAEWTLFGKSVTGDSISLAVRNSSKLNTNVYHTSVTSANAVADGGVIDIDFTNTPKSVFVVIDYSQTNLNIQAGDESKFSVAVSAPSITPVNKTLDRTNKRYICEYSVSRTGTLQVMSSSVSIGGIAYQSPTLSVTLRAVLPEYSVSADKAQMNPGESAVISAVVGSGMYTDNTTPSAGATFKGAYTVAHEVVSGSALVTTSNSGNSFNVSAKKPSAGGIVAVRTTINVDSGVFAGHTFQKLTYITIKDYAAPTLKTTAARPMAFGETADLSTLIDISHDSGDTQFAYTVSYTYPASSNELAGTGSSFKPKASVRNTVVPVTVTVNVTAGYFAGNTLSGTISVPVKPGLSITAGSFITAGAELALGVQLTDGNGAAVTGHTLDTVFSVKSGDGYIVFSGGRYTLKANAPSAGGSVVLTAAAVIRGGSFDGASLSAEFTVKILSVAFAGELSRLPGGEVNPADIGAVLKGDGADKPLDAELLSHYNVEMHCVYGAGDYGKTSVSGNKLLIAKDANFTSGPLRTVFTLRLTDKSDASKVFYNETYLNIAKADLPVLKVSYQIGTGTVDEGIDVLAKDDVITFRFSIAGGVYTNDEITSVTLASDQSAGTVMPVDKTTVNYKVSGLYSGSVQFTFKALVYGQEITCAPITGSVSSVSTGDFVWTADYAEVSPGGTAEITLNMPASASIYSFKLSFTQQMKNNFSKVTMYSDRDRAGTAYMLSSSSGISFYNLSNRIKDVKLVFEAKSPTITNVNYSIATTVQYMSNSNYYSAYPAIALKTVSKTLSSGDITLAASTKAAAMNEAINLSVSAANYNDVKVTFGVSGTGASVTASGMVTIVKSDAAQQVTATAYVKAGGNNFTAKEKSVTLYFVPSSAIYIGGEQRLSLPKGESGILSLASGAAAYATSVVYESSNPSVVSVTSAGADYTARAQAKGSCKLKATYTIGGVTFTDQADILVTESPTLTVQKSDRTYTLSVSSGAPDYAYTFMETGTNQSPLVTVVKNGNAFTFTDKPDTLGGTVTVKFTATYSTGDYRGLVLSETVQFTVAAPALPALTLTAAADSVEAVCNYPADFSYRVVYGASALSFADSTDKHFTVSPQRTDVTAVVRVTATLTDAPYENYQLIKDIEIFVPAAAKPVFAVAVTGETEQGGKITATLDGSEVSVGLTVLSGAAAVSIQPDGSFTKNPQIIAATAVVKVSYTVSSGPFAGDSFNEFVVIDVDAAEAPVFTKLVNDADANTILAECNYAADITYKVLAGGEALSFADEKSPLYTITRTEQDVEVVVEVSAKITEGAYGEVQKVISDTLSITVHKKLTLSAVLAPDNTVTADCNYSDILLTYAVTGGGAAAEFDAVQVNKLNFTPQAADTAVEITVTASVTSGPMTGETQTAVFTITVPAAPGVTLTHEAAAGKITPQTASALSLEFTIKSVSNQSGGGALILDPSFFSWSNDGYFTYDGSAVTSDASIDLEIEYTVTEGILQGYKGTFTQSLTLYKALTLSASLAADNTVTSIINYQSDEVELTYAVTGGGQAAAFDAMQSNKLIFTPQATDTEVEITVTASVIAGPMTGETQTAVFTVTVPAAPVVTLMHEAAVGKITPQAVGGFTLDYAIKSVDNVVGGGALSLDPSFFTWLADGYFTYNGSLLNDDVSFDLAIEYTVTEGMLAGYKGILTQSVTLYKAFKLSAELEPDNTVKVNCNYPDDVRFAYEIKSGSEAAAFDAVQLNKLIFTPQAADTEVEISVTAFVISGPFANVEANATFTVTVPALPAVTLAHDAAAQKITPQTASGLTLEFTVKSVSNQSGGGAAIVPSFFTWSADGYFTYDGSALTDDVSFDLEIEYTVTEGLLKDCTYTVSQTIGIAAPVIP